MIVRDYLIVGAGAAGVAACESIREHDKKGSIMLVGAEPHPAIRRPDLLQSVLGKTIPQPSQLYVHPLSWFQSAKVDLRLDTIVNQFNLDQKAAVLATGQAVKFHKALLATGSRARRPQVAGANLGNIFYLRSVRECLALREVVDLEKGVVVIGSGFVAAETALLLNKLKLKVTLISRAPHIWGRILDPETAAWVTKLFTDEGITLMMNEHLSGFEGRTVLHRVQTKSGQRMDTSVAIVAAGSEPNLQLVSASPLWSQNGCPVTERLESDELGIYAAGDIALYPNPAMGGMRREEHWDAAVAMGHVAGANMTGKKRIKFEYIPWFWSELRDNRFDFVGDFTRVPTRVRIEGDRDKKRKFVAYYYQMNKVSGVMFCNEDQKTVQSVRADFKKLH